MAKNEFLPFGTAEGANVLSNQEYEALAARHNGFTSGVAKSKELNKVWRQASLIASAVAQFIVDTDQKDLLDTGDFSDIKARLSSAINLIISNGDYVTNPYLKLELLKKIDKADITQQLGNDTGKVVSQNLLTTELGKKASVADANSKLAKDQNGADIPNKPKFIENLGLPEKYQPKGDYQPAGDYALQSEVNKKRDITNTIFKSFSFNPYNAEKNSLWFYSSESPAWEQGLARNGAEGTGYSNFRSNHSGDVAHTNELLGFGQHWQDVKSQRQIGVVYRNTTGKPIVVCIGKLFQLVPQGEYAGFGFYVDDVRVASYGGNSDKWVDNLSVIIPAGSSYNLAADVSKISFEDWAELRG